MCADVSTFQGIDRHGFPEDEDIYPFLGMTLSGNLSPNSTQSDSSSWLMGGPNTGIDDTAGVALAGAGALMLLPGPTYLAAGAAGTALLKHPAGALVGMAAYAGLSLAVIGVGRTLSGLD